MVTCPIVRWLALRRLVRDQPLPPRLAAHVRGCRPCAAFYDEQITLTRRLSAPVRPAEVRPFLRRRVLAALETQARQPVNVVPRWSAAFTAVLVAGLVMLVLVQRQDVTNDARSVTVSAPPGHFEAKPLAFPFVAVDVSGLGENLEKPLEEEAQLVAADARQAIRSLAAYFLPDNAKSWGALGP